MLTVDDIVAWINIQAGLARASERRFEEYVMKTWEKRHAEGRLADGKSADA